MPLHQPLLPSIKPLKYCTWKNAPSILLRFQELETAFHHLPSGLAVTWIFIVFACSRGLLLLCNLQPALACTLGVASSWTCSMTFMKNYIPPLFWRLHLTMEQQSGLRKESNLPSASQTSLPLGNIEHKIHSKLSPNIINTAFWWRCSFDLDRKQSVYYFLQPVLVCLLRAAMFHDRRHWNRLPGEAVDAPSLEVFNIRLDGAYSNLV